MPRVPSFAILAATSIAVAIIASAGGCNDVETSNPPDAALPPCDPGPFAFPGPLGGDQASVPACSADENPKNYEAIMRLPRGSRYSEGTTVNYVGDRDPQGDCNPRAVCKCQLTGSTAPPPPIVDAGADADAAPPPAPAPTPGVLAWECFDY